MKIFQFKVFDDKIRQYIEMQKNQTQFIITLIDDFRKGKLVPLETRELDKKFKILKMEEIQKKLILLDFEIKRKAIESGHSPYEALKVLKSEIKVIDSQQIAVTLLGQDLLCEKCHHFHLIYNKSCSKWDCNCEVRV